MNLLSIRRVRSVKYQGVDIINGGTEKTSKIKLETRYLKSTILELDRQFKFRLGSPKMQYELPEPSAYPDTPEKREIYKTSKTTIETDSRSRL